MSCCCIFSLGGGTSAASLPIKSSGGKEYVRSPVTITRYPYPVELILASPDREQAAAVYLIISMIGYCTTAFFISRTYMLFFYVFAAMCVACYIRASRLHPDIESSMSWPLFFKCALGAFLSLPVMYVIIVFLLRL